MDTLIFGLQVAAIGMGIVFVALFILQYVIDILSKLIAKAEKPNSVVPIVDNTPQVLVTENEDDTDVIAVIMAAITAYAEADQKNYKITAIKRINNSQNWSSAGRQQIMQDRLARI